MVHKVLRKRRDDGVEDGVKIKGDEEAGQTRENAEKEELDKILKETRPSTVTLGEMVNLKLGE